MPILKKEIVADQTYTTKALVGDKLVDHKRRFDPVYQNRLVTSANSMIAGGLKIPAPFGHSKQAVPLTETEVLVNHGTPQSSFNNAGYWQFFKIEKNEQGKPALFGYVDVPGSEDDPESPYYKAKNSAKEVSISIRDQYKDGLEREWKDAIMHVALVNHPVVPGQSDFQDVPDGAFAVNMSMIDDDYKDDPTPSLGLISQLKTALADKGIVLPSDCSPKTILRDILVAVSQKSTSGVNELPPVPIYMSTLGDDSMPLSIDAAKALVASKAVNPDTKQPFTMEDLGFKQQPAQLDLSNLQSQLNEKDKSIAGLKSIINAMMASSANKIKTEIQSRLNALKARGVPDATIATLQPQVEFQMSMLPDGSGIAPHPLEVVLSTLEASLPEVKVPVAPSNNLPQGAYTLPNPYGTDNNLSEADMDLSINDILANLK